MIGIVDLEALVPARDAAELREFCIQQGREGGRLGGAPKKVDLLNIEEKIVQAQLDFEGNRPYWKSKAPEKDQSWGFVAKARFCELWHKATKIVENEDVLMSYLVKTLGRRKNCRRQSKVRLSGLSYVPKQAVVHQVSSNTFRKGCRSI